LTYHVRLMRKEDVAQVTDIDHEAFSSWWPLTSYEHELENRLAHYLVAYDDGEKWAGAEGEERGFARITSKVKGLFNPNNGKELPPEPQDKITGFAGFWIMAGEAHIISIAVRAAYRGRGIGELILAHLIDHARSLGADVVTLEARVSNNVAQSLYLKYGFKNVGTRTAYYTDNREDAVIMTTDTIISLPYQSRLRKLKREYTRRYGLEFEEKAELHEAPPPAE
jgi:ribosomal-protein-alanine N-acetyltransferase